MLPCTVPARTEAFESEDAICALEAPSCPVRAYVGAIERFLCSYGRQINVKPLYKGLCDRGERETALEIFSEARDGYHPIVREQMARLLEAA